MSNVSHPAHYNAGKIEVIEFLEDQFMNRPHEWNACKYLARADKKGRELEDLEKAIWYIKRKIELISAKETGVSPRRPNDMNVTLGWQPPKDEDKRFIERIDALSKELAAKTDKTPEVGFHVEHHDPYLEGDPRNARRP